MKTQNQNKQGKNTLRKKEADLSVGANLHSSEPKCSLDKSDCTQTKQTISDDGKLIVETKQTKLYLDKILANQQILFEHLQMIMYNQYEDRKQTFVVSLKNLKEIERKYLNG